MRVHGETRTRHAAHVTARLVRHDRAAGEHERLLQKPDYQRRGRGAEPGRDGFVVEVVL